MQLANVWVTINELGSNCEMKNITPAEAVIIRHQFGKKISGQSRKSNPISHFDLLSKGTDRTSGQEFDRLTKKYGENLMKEVFPGESPALPTDFAMLELFEKGQEVEKAPKAGPIIKIEPLPSVRKVDHGDDAEPSQVQLDTAAMKAQLEQQGALIAKLQEALTKLASQSPQQAQVPQQPPAK